MDDFLGLKCTGDEKATVRAAAQAEGLTLSEFIRQAALERAGEAGKLQSRARRRESALARAVRATPRRVGEALARIASVAADDPRTGALVRALADVVQPKEGRRTGAKAGPPSPDEQ